MIWRLKYLLRQWPWIHRAIGIETTMVTTGDVHDFRNPSCLFRCPSTRPTQISRHPYPAFEASAVASLGSGHLRNAYIYIYIYIYVIIVL
jgi:hypothetical protein